MGSSDPARVEGYAGRLSYAPGEVATLHLSVTRPGVRALHPPGGAVNGAGAGRPAGAGSALPVRIPHGATPPPAS